MGIFFKKKNDSLEKRQYFSYLNTVKKRHFDSIIANKNNNNKIALQKKDFEKIRTIQLKPNDKLIVKDVDWYKYILKYFKKKYKEGALWYHGIIQKVSNIDYLFETHYQSYSFFKDFEMKYKSQCLNNIKEDIDEEDEIDKEEELLLSLRRNTMIDLSRNSRMDLSGITDNYGGSFGEYKEDLDLYDEDLGIKRKKKLKEFIKILKRHLNQKDHPINIIISIYCHHFSLMVKNQIETIIDMENKDENSSINIDQKIKNISDKIIDDLKRFIIKIQSTTKLFYCKSTNLDFFIEEKDELINLMTSKIFLQSDIYKNIYNLFSIQFKNEVNDFKYKLFLVKNIKPKDLNIPNKLSLDENTTKEINKFKEEYKLKKEKEGNFNINENNNNKIFVPEDGYIKGFHSKNKINGYNTVVQMLQGLKYAKTPFDKMMIIASMSTEITQCVDMYWNNMDNYLPNYYLSINADEFISLYILMVIRAQDPELIIHEKIIQNFTTKTTKSSTIGYYNLTLNAAIEYVQNEAVKDLQNNDNKGLRNSAHLISKFFFKNINYKGNSDEFILIDNKGSRLSSNIDSRTNKNNNEIKKILTKKYSTKSFKNLFGIEEEIDEKNFELSIKNYDYYK